MSSSSRGALKKPRPEACKDLCRSQLSGATDGRQSHARFRVATFRTAERTGPAEGTLRRVADARPSRRAHPHTSHHHRAAQKAKMKVTSLSLWKWNGDNVEPTCLGRAEDVTEFGYFQRPSVREMLTFISRTIVKRTQPGQRQSVEQDAYLVHVSNRSGLVAIAVMDKEYPSRSAFCVLGKMCDDYVDKVVGEGWRVVTEDDQRGDALLATAIARYQDPMEADKILKIQVRVAFPKSRRCLPPLFECTTRDVCSIASTTVTLTSTRGSYEYITNALFAHTVHPYARLATDPFLFHSQRELDETKVVLHKTIDSVLARGEKLDNLVDKSTDLSLASQMFYKQAKKQNQCCTMM
jgi:synaptobrevin family protein YKT6